MEDPRLQVWGPLERLRPPEELCEVSQPLPGWGAHRDGTGEQQTPLEKRRSGAGAGMRAASVCPVPGEELCHRELPRAARGPLSRDGDSKSHRRPAHAPTPAPIPTCPLLHVVPQQVAAGEVLHAEVLDNPSGDGAFPGARRAHDDGAQQRRHHHAAPAAPGAPPAAPGAPGARARRARQERRLPGERRLAPPGSPGPASPGKAAAASPAVSQRQEGKILYVNAQGEGEGKG
ncbi:hypothetical protein Nmel_008143 [Mimus melanotis]